MMLYYWPLFQWRTMGRQKLNPNVCPACVAPLTTLMQCIMPDCITNVLCGHCMTRLTPFQKCPNADCAKFDDTPVQSVISPAQSMFEDITVLNIVCHDCATTIPAEMQRCPICDIPVRFETLPPPRSTLPPSTAGRQPPPRYSGIVPKNASTNPDNRSDEYWDDVLRECIK